jgi:hypothetical protein
VEENMKSTRQIVLFLLFSIAGMRGAAIAGNPRTVVVTNNTSYTMTEFFASPSSSDSDWDTTNNLFTGQTLAPGQQTTITIDSGNDGDHHCHYDLMAVLYGTTQAAYTYSVDTCGGGGSWSITGM